MITSNRIEGITERIVASVEPDRAILFGSRARGDNSERSDYGICVLKTGVVHAEISRSKFIACYMTAAQPLMLSWKRRSALSS